MSDLIGEAVEEATSQELRKTVDSLQRRLASERDRSDRIVAAVGAAIREGVSALDLPPVPSPPRDRRKSGPHTAVIMLSDWQLGKRTPSYSSDVCEQRVEQLAGKVADLVGIQRESYPVKRLAVFLLGDMIEGELIFPGQAHEIDSSLYRQVTVDGPRILGGFIRSMLTQFEQVDVYAVPGNHGAIGGRARRDMDPESNGDRMLYQITRMVLDGEDRLSWQMPERDWYTVADLGDKARFLLLHGDNVRGHAGIPWYGWTRKVLAWSSLSSLWPDMEFDHVAAGHFHTPVSLYINGKRLWINASTESHNPYALEQLAAAGEPAQWLLIVKPGQGVTSEHLVRLT